jgi:tetratricopeptide (TPR) repeat protein
MASLNHALKRYDEAENMYQECLQGRKNKLGVDHSETLLTLSKYADLLEQQGKFLQAEPLYLSLLQLRRQKLGSEHPDSVLALTSITKFYESQKKYNEAERYGTQLLRLLENLNGKSDSKTIDIRSRLAEVKRNLGKNAEAKKLLETNLEFPNSSSAKGQSTNNSESSIKNMVAISAMLAQEGKVSEALVSYQKALDKASSSLGYDNAETLSIVNEIGQLYQRIGDVPKAQKIYEEGLNKNKSLEGDNLLIISNIQNALGLIYRDHFSISHIMGL